MDKPAVILSGAAGDIGSFVTARLVSNGYDVIAVDINQDALDALGDEGVTKICCDLTNREEIEEKIGPLFEAHRIEVLINNAGAIYNEPLYNMLSREDKKHSSEGWNKTIDANLGTAFNLTSSVVNGMIGKKFKGVIINVSSVAAQGNIGQTAYSAAKAAINAMTVTWAKELGMFGIRSVSIAPGFFNTPSTSAALTEANLKKWTKSVPLNRLGELDELYHGIDFLINNTYYNGKVLELDGGLSI